MHKPNFYCPAVGPPNAKGDYSAKQSYRSKEEAQKAHPAARAYLCPNCGQWHLTSKKVKKRR